MKKISLFILIIMFMPLALLSACGDVKFDVKFIIDNQEYAIVSTVGNEVISIPDNPSKEGYAFDGWYWDENTWEKPFTINSLLNQKLKSDMIVYAKFNIKQYSIQYNLDGGSLENENEVITYEQLPYTLPTPSKTGYSFNGWKVNLEDEEYVTQLTVANAQDYTLNAVWTLIDIRDAVKFEDATYTYDGTEKVLLATDVPSYVNVSYSQNKLTNVGEINVTATFEFANYIFTKIAKLKITKATYDLSDLRFESVSYVYDGTEKILSVSGELPDNVLVYYENNNNIDVGTYNVIAKFIVNNTNYYDIDDMSATLIITKATYNMNNISFYNATYIYDGTEKTLAITGILPQGVSVQYQNNKLTNVGSIIAVASFTGDSKNYYVIPSKTATLTIEKANYDLSNITFADATYTYDGTEKTIAISGILPDGVSVSYSNNKRTNAGISTAIARFTGDTENYFAIPNMTAKLRINKAVYDISNITFESASYVYDGTEKKIEITETLPDGVSIQYTNNKRTNAGTSSAIACFIYDTENYETLQNKTATLTITKATYDMSSVLFDDKSFVYDGNAKSIYITGTLPQGVNVEYSGNEKTNVGEYEIIATFTGNSTNYKSIPNKVAVLTIEKATPIITPYYNGDITTETSIELLYNENIAGTLKFDDNQILVIGINNYNWTFVPQDTDNYNIKKGQISIIVKAIVNFYNENTLYHTKLVEKDDYVSAPQIPTKADYQGYAFTFSYWSLENNETEFDFDTQVENNTNLYALYSSSEIEYTITYHNTKDVTNDNKTNFYVSTSTFDVNNLEKTGYVFDGWYDSNNYINRITQIAKGTFRNIDLYAKWTAIQYTITYHSEYDVPNPNPITFTIEDEVVLQNLNNIEHYNFVGWYIDNVFANSINTINAGSVGNIDLYGKWEFTGTLISTYMDLLLINNNLAGEYKLINDIDLNGTTWTPYGYINESQYNKFNGYFDGSNFTISNFNISSYYGGFFVYLSSSAVVCNVKYSNVKCSGSYGCCGIVACENYGLINNVYVSECRVSDTNAGLLVGINSGEISNSCATGSVNANSIGGGLCAENKKIIKESMCYVSSIIVSSNSGNVGDLPISPATAGGLIGYADSSSDVLNCCAINCSVKASASGISKYYPACAYAGGLIGRGLGEIRCCYSTNNIECNAAGSYPTAYVGGLVGYASEFGSNKPYIIKSFTLCVLQASASYAINKNLFVGNNIGTFTNCYSNTSTKETIWAFIYANWDNSIWNLYLDKNPTLKCFN